MDVKDPTVSFVKVRRAIIDTMNKFQISAIITAEKGMETHPAMTLGQETVSTEPQLCNTQYGTSTSDVHNYVRNMPNGVVMGSRQIG